MTSVSDVMDPMYNFDTHFPERLSHLHIHGDTLAAPTTTAPCLRKKRSRQNRNAARYKTQPVTFEEIREVDEEPASATREGGTDGDRQKHLLGQLQAFSRSMDGLVPGHVMLPNHMIGVQRSGSFSRSGSRKWLRHPECIPERVEGEDKESQKTNCETATDRLEGSATQQTEKRAPLATSESLDPADSAAGNTPTSDNLTGSTSTDSSSTGCATASVRRQRMTAKAKKRQKAQEDAGEGS